MRDYSTTAISASLGISRQAVLERARLERWVYQGSGKAIRWKGNHLPNDVLSALSREGLLDETRIVPSDGNALGSYEAFTAVRDEDRKIASLRACLINQYVQSGMRKEDFVSEYNAGRVNGALRSRLGEVTLKTFYRWFAAWDKAGRSLEGLTPRWSLRKTEGPGASIPELVRHYAENFFLHPHCPSIGHVRNKLIDLERAGLIVQAPTYQTLYRYLNSLPPTLVDYWRKGPTKWANAYQSHIERDMGLYRPMELVTSDHVMLDFVVTKDGRMFRPWLTTVQDFRSGLILGACPCVTPSWLSITVALSMMAIQYGRAEIFTVDNGQDYRCKLLNGQTDSFKSMDLNGFEEEEAVYVAGFYQACVDRVSFTWAYSGKSKGRQERTHGIWQEYFSKEMRSYVGSNTVTRPEVANLLFRAVNKQAKRNDIPTWEEFVEELASYLDRWNDEWRSNGNGMDGRTPRQVFDALKGDIRPVDRNVLEVALCRSEKRKVGRNGVRVDGVNFWAPELQRYTGTDVLVKRPLADPETALICDARGAVLCRAEADYFRETEDLAETIERRQKAAKSNLEMVRGLSSGKVEPPESKRSILDARRGKALEDTSLALAAGGENDPHPGMDKKALKEERERSNAFMDLIGREA
jgi:hypothetical protein